MRTSVGHCILAESWNVAVGHGRWGLWCLSLTLVTASVLWWLQACAKLKTKPSAPRPTDPPPLRRRDTALRSITPTVPRVPSAAAQVSHTHGWRCDPVLLRASLGVLSQSKHVHVALAASCVVLNVNKISETCLSKSRSWTDRCTKDKDVTLSHKESSTQSTQHPG